MTRRRIAVTGTGVISPLGLTMNETWGSLMEGRSGIGPITRFDTSDFATTIAGEVKDFDPTVYFSKKFVRQMDLFIQYAVAASYQALESAGLSEPESRPDPERCGVFVGAGLA